MIRSYARYAKTPQISWNAAISRHFQDESLSCRSVCLFLLCRDLFVQFLSFFCIHTLSSVTFAAVQAENQSKVQARRAQRDRFQLDSATALPTMISYWTLTCRTHLTPLSLSLSPLLASPCHLLCFLLELTKIAVPIVCIGAHTAHHCTAQCLASCCCNSLVCVCVWVSK